MSRKYAALQAYSALSFVFSHASFVVFNIHVYLYVVLK